MTHRQHRQKLSIGGGMACPIDQVGSHGIDGRLSSERLFGIIIL